MGLGAVALLAPPAEAARYAVGVPSVAGLPALQAALPGAESLAPVPAVVVERAAAPRLADLPGATYVERLGRRRLSFVPTDPLAPKQWHLVASHAFDYWDTLPLLAPVRVAVIDSGVDGTHPELAGKIVAAETFVGGSATVDREGHGTFVAGLIAASIDNAAGIAGMVPSAELLVAKVVDGDRQIDVEAEVRAIRWAVAQRAQVINMSLGGLRDPRNRDLDTFSPLEAAAVAYAHGKGVVVVAAVGNGDAAPVQPWPYASYPAALPHVLGVSALTRDGAVPAFSNRDKIFNDIAAPGQDILSTLPLAMTAPFKECVDQGYSSCGPEEFRRAEGTSFAAPQVSAAAAVLLSLRPTLRPEQVTKILQSAAIDLDSSTGCSACAAGRDAYSGWGRLDVAAAIAALSKRLPARDHYETNDDLGSRAYVTYGSNRRLHATVDFWDDQDDVYAIQLARNQPVYVGLTGEDTTVELGLALWNAKARSVENVSDFRHRLATSTRPGSRQFLSFRPKAGGTFYVQVRMASPGTTRYRLTVVKG